MPDSHALINLQRRPETLIVNSCGEVLQLWEQVACVARACKAGDLESVSSCTTLASKDMARI